MPDGSSSSSSSPTPVPVTVFTGFLGAGKTSLILSLLTRLPSGTRAVLLKNEFGDIAVDSQLAAQASTGGGSLAGVSEIVNGCLCCVLVGQMKTALKDILDNYHPDRIIVECSGSAFPATLAFQIRGLERETQRALALDAIVTVIDAENFAGYEDTSVTARLQAQYTDVLLINKWEHVSERALDDVLELLNELNDLTPKIRCTPGPSVDPALVFGLGGSQVFFSDSSPEATASDAPHHEEVETATVWRGGVLSGHDHDHGHDHAHVHEHGDDDVEPTTTTEETLDGALAALPKETIYRAKGFVRLSADASSRIVSVNWAFGRVTIVDAPGALDDAGADVRMTIMGERGEVKRAAGKLAAALGARVKVN